MQRATTLRLVPALLPLLLLLLGGIAEAAAGPELPRISFYHRFSAALRGKARELGVEWAFPAWSQSSAAYHDFQARRDLARHGRRLASSPSAAVAAPVSPPTPLFFFDGNETGQFESLYYAIIEVGTPKVSHLVALDTGSDLLWIPCECRACAPASAPAFVGLPSLNVYTPTTSTTSKRVSCGSPECSADFSVCSNQSIPSTGQCVYEVDYAQANTSTTGTMYQDVLYLTRSEGNATLTPEVFVGCGQTQTGSLVDGSGVPDGLLGLGRQNYSVPSSIAAAGLVGDSFSVCFSAEEATGRILFGDYGSTNLTTTPFLDTSNSSSRQGYYVGLTSIRVQDRTLTFEGEAPVLFDTGTSLTLLPTAVYEPFLSAFANQTTEFERANFSGVFDLCYAIGGSSLASIPSVVFEFSGGANLVLLSPIVGIYFQSNGSLVGFCAGVVDSGVAGYIVLGVNDMYGYNIVFNREQSTLGWELSYCNATEVSLSTDSPAVSPAFSPMEGPVTAPVLSPSAGAPPPIGGASGPATITSPGTLGTPGSAPPPPPPPPSAAPGTRRGSRLSALFLGFLSSALLAATALSL